MRARKLPQNASPAPVASTTCTACLGMRTRCSRCRQICAGLAHLQHHHLRPEAQIEVQHRIGIGEAGQCQHVLDSRQRIVGRGHRRMHHRGGARRRPQARAVVGIIGDLHAIASRDVDRGEHRIGGGRGNALADAGDIEHARRRDRRFGQIGGRVHRGGGVGAVVQEVMALRVMRDEIDAGQPAVGADHGGRIDALARPQRHEAVAGHVVAECGDVADARALPCRGDRGVRGVAAVAFQVMPRAVGLQGKLVELQHRLAHAQQIDRHGAAITWRAAASIAARSPAAMRRSSTSAPPMPTNAAPAAR